MSRFIDPADTNVDSSLSVANWDGNNLSYIVSREGPSGKMTSHYHTDPLFKKTVVPFDEEKTTPDTIIQVSLMVPGDWCKAIQDVLYEGTYCKSQAQDEMVPMAMNAKWSDFQPDPSGNGNMTNTFNISTLGHAFEMVWAKAKGPPIVSQLTVSDKTCCIARVATCLACEEGKTVNEYCAIKANAQTPGCQQFRGVKTWGSK